MGILFNSWNRIRFGRIYVFFLFFSSSTSFCLQHEGRRFLVWSRRLLQLRITALSVARIETHYSDNLITYIWNTIYAQYVGEKLWAIAILINVRVSQETTGRVRWATYRTKKWEKIDAIWSGNDSIWRIVFTRILELHSDLSIATERTETIICVVVWDEIVWKMPLDCWSQCKTYTNYEEDNNSAMLTAITSRIKAVSVNGSIRRLYCKLC